jgi:hypothetical protein
MAGILDALTPTTIANYARGAWDGITINSWLLGELKKKGIFQFDVGGDTLSGPVEGGRYQPTISAPGQDLSSLFVPKVRHQRWNFSWGEMVNALVIDRGLLRRNSGDQALVRLKDTEVPALFRDLLIAQGGLVYHLLNTDGGAYTGGGLPIYGLPTFLRNVADLTNLYGFNPANRTLPSDGAWTASAAGSTGTSVAVADPEVHCVAQTYGGLSLAPAGLTSSVDKAQWDMWTPTMVNGDSSFFNGTAGTTDATRQAIIELSLQYLLTRLTRFSASDTSMIPNIGLLDANYYRLLGTRKAGRETVFVQTSQKSPDTPDTGFEPIKGLWHAGIMWRWEENMPTSTAIAGNTSRMKFWVQPLYKDQENGSPLKVSGAEAGIMETAINFDPLRRQYLVSATIPGQATFEPRYWGCVRQYKGS